MLSPFPGMDPYLEHPELWPEVHNRLIVAIADSLAPKLRPKYRVAIEKRTYLTSGEDLIFVGRPDATVLSQQPITIGIQRTSTSHPSSQPITVGLPIPETLRESYLEVRDVAAGEVVTALEVLSPSNKRLGEGRRTYELKRQRILASLTHLVEIDLLRGGEPMPTLHDEFQTTYRVLISRAARRPLGDLYSFGIRGEIPSFPLPLRSEDAEPWVDLQTLLNQTYDRAGYDLVIDYSHPPVPPLPEEDAAWVNALLMEKKLR